MVDKLYEFGGRRGRRCEDQMPRGSDVVDGCVELIARATDAAERVVNTATDYDPRYGSRTCGDVVRQSPGMVGRVVYAVNDGLRDVNDTLSDLMDLRSWERPRSRTGGRTASNVQMDAVDADLPTEDDVVRESRRFINRGRYRGATLDGLIRHLRGLGGYSGSELEAIVARHFVIDGDLVLSPGRDNKSELPDAVEEHLRALGYTDLRRNVRLERLEEDAPQAQLVAYTLGQPVILVMRVDSRRFSDADTIETARFQAKALSRAATPTYVYLTDGVANLYYSVADDRIVTQLPRSTASDE